ncbi:MAG TPA: hypothetical protein VGC13_27400 [Longimicrobium sp.]|uniref:hypothetical protein n=1 Tax=Longimicrobium sp. TaxID=2029185 RepID=UPI002EDBA3FA
MATESSSPGVPTQEGLWCYNDFLDQDEIAGTDEIDQFSSFLTENEGSIVRLNLMICREAVHDHYSREHDILIVDSVRIGRWPVEGFDLRVKQRESGDILWQPQATGAYDALQGYFVILRVSAVAPQSGWLNVDVRPVRIEDVLLGRAGQLRRPTKGASVKSQATE